MPLAATSRRRCPFITARFTTPRGAPRPTTTTRLDARRAARASRRQSELSAPLADPAVVGGEDPVHRAGRAQVGALVQQRRVGLLRSDVNEALGAQHLQTPLAL